MLAVDDDSSCLPLARCASASPFLADISSTKLHSPITFGRNLPCTLLDSSDDQVHPAFLARVRMSQDDCINKIFRLRFQKVFVDQEYSRRAIYNFHVGLINAAEVSRACGYRSA
jgi:hypothetical protein